jgi:hypothetical protein
VHRVAVPWCRRSCPQPVEQLIGVGVTRELVESEDLRSDREVAAVGFQRSCVAEEVVTTGAGYLKSGKNDEITWVRVQPARWWTTRPPVAMPDARFRVTGEGAGGCIADEADGQRSARKRSIG